MYIIRNALRSVGRSPGRNILIGIIVAVIAAAACIGLSIRQAAANAREEGLETLTVTAQISMDMQSMMGDRGQGGFDRENFGERLDKMQGLSLEELETYATADSVQNFYYTVTMSINGSDTFEPVSNTSEDTEDGGGKGGFGGFGGMPGMGGMGGGFGGMSSNDFSLVGYSADEAMTDFISGNAAVTEGACFEEQTTAYDCLISSELATFNDLNVGDTVTIENPDNEEETYTLTVVGIYEGNGSASTGGIPGFGGKGSFGATDPTNTLYMSAAAVEKIAAASAEVEQNEEDDTALSGSVSGTYVFGNVESYEAFEAEARTLGLPEEYTVSSSDITAYEQSLVPLDTLSTFASYFLIIVLIIGGVILVVLNLFNIRERKYEVGVLTAIGMKKWKVATQFLCEVFAVTVLAVCVGGAAGAVSAVPLTNALLENQVTSQSRGQEQLTEAFGRGEMPNIPGMPSDRPDDMPDRGGGGFGGFFRDFGQNAVDYVDEISTATDLTVLVQLLGVAILLTLVASTVSVVFIMRYDPLRILSNRD